jgi:cell division initiation protein
MLTPLDIHNKAFTKGMRGYKMEEVDAFLDEVIRHYESLFRENHELKERVKRMEDEVARSKELGQTLQKTMLMAQKLVDDETIRAKKEGELILWEAQKKGEQMIQEAKNEVLSINQEIERLKLYEKQLYLKHKGFLEFQMELLDGYKENTELPAITEALDAVIPNDGEALAAEEIEPSVNEIVTAQPEAEQEAFNEKALSEAEDLSEAISGDTSEESSDDAQGQEGLQQVYLMAQKMEEALKSLDTIYGADEKSPVEAVANDVKN